VDRRRLTSALFAVGKWLIGLYIGKSSVACAFGAAGSLVVLTVCVYYFAQIFLLGAEFTCRQSSARRFAAGVLVRALV
jgi:membrane protein